MMSEDEQQHYCESHLETQVLGVRRFIPSLPRIRIIIAVDNYPF